MSNNRKGKPRPPDIDQLARIFKALSNPNRLRIFVKLASLCTHERCCPAGPDEMRRCAGELGADLALAPSTVSHHLKELRQSGLLNVERRGQKIECWLDEDTLAGVRDFFSSTRTDHGATCGCARNNADKPRQRRRKAS